MTNSTSPLTEPIVAGTITVWPEGERTSECHWCGTSIHNPVGPHFDEKDWYDLDGKANCPGDYPPLRHQASEDVWDPTDLD